VCLVVFAWQAHPEFRLLLGANRDELHSRPAQALHWWPDESGLLAGRDLQAGGTWLAVSRSGRFATVTNYREQQRKKPGYLSRGELVAGFVAGRAAAGDFVASIEGDRFAGFSLLACDGRELWYVSNRGDGPACLEAGVYGLSNAALDTPWPKLVRSREALRNLIDAGTANETSLTRVLEDRRLAPAPDVDDPAIPFKLAHAVTAPFIVTPDYGTRCTTVLTWSASGQIGVSERRFDPGGQKTGESRFSFAVTPAQSAS